MNFNDGDAFGCAHGLVRSRACRSPRRATACAGLPGRSAASWTSCASICRPAAWPRWTACAASRRRADRRSGAGSTGPGTPPASAARSGRRRPARPVTNLRRGADPSPPRGPDSAPVSPGWPRSVPTRCNRAGDPDQDLPLVDRHQRAARSGTPRDLATRIGRSSP